MQLQLAQEIAKRNQLELKLQQSTLDLTQLKMLNHHLEQEILRYQDTLEAVSVINPNQVRARFHCPYRAHPRCC